MSSNNNKRQFILNQMLWLGVSLGLSLAISILLPFPISLVTIIGVFILFNIYMKKRMIRRMGMGSGGGVRGVGMFGSMSSSPSMFGDTSLKYYCMSCGTQHKGLACPSCGSKMKRAGG